MVIKAIIKTQDICSQCHQSKIKRGLLIDDHLVEHTLSRNRSRLRTLLMRQRKQGQCAVIMDDACLPVDTIWQ